MNKQQLVGGNIRPRIIQLWRHRPRALSKMNTYVILNRAPADMSRSLRNHGVKVGIE